MTKKELIAIIAEKAEVKKVDAENVLDVLVSVVTEELTKGGEVTLSGLGKFEVRERAARTGRNPQTGETMEIAAKAVPAFKAAKALKDAVKGE